MASLQRRLYISTFINSFGSWLTFLGIALLVNEAHGAKYVALVFLVQTLPAILFSRSIASLIPVQWQERVYWISQVVLALNCLVLCVSQNLVVIFAHLFIGAFVKSISLPLFNTLLGRWVPNEEQKRVFTKVGALQAGTLALAPAIGAWIKITYSAEAMFMTDAASFLISIALLKELFQTRKPATVEATTDRKSIWGSLLAGVSLKPGDMPLVLHRPLWLWFVFLFVGAFFNAIEFAGFAKIGLTEKQIGYAMAAWGIGCLVAFVVSVPNILKNTRIQAMGYVVGIGAFVVVAHAHATITTFLVAGLFSSYLAGTLRSNLQAAVPANYNAAPVWAYANQITQVINLICYATVAATLDLIGFQAFGALTVAAALPLVFSRSHTDG